MRFIYVEDFTFATPKKYFAKNLAETAVLLDHFIAKRRI